MLAIAGAMALLLGMVGVAGHQRRPRLPHPRPPTTRQLAENIEMLGGPFFWQMR